MRIEIANKEQCETFIHIFTNLKYFTDKILVSIKSDKLYIQGMDDSHVCIYELFLQKSWFTNWEVDENNDYGIFLPIFNKMLCTWTDNHRIILTSGDSNDKLDIELLTDVKGEFDKIFELPLMDIDLELMGIPETEYEADIVMNSRKFKSTIDSLSYFSDTFNITCKDEKLELESNSSEGSMKVEINMDDIESLAAVEDDTIESSFGIKYIGYMCQFNKLSNNVNIHLSNDIPIQIKYEITDDSFMRFYLAPKIKDD
jgi:proliferating cell nuclear antigen